MSIRPYTQAEIDRLCLAPKRIINPQARWSEKPKAKPGHRQRSFQAIGRQDDGLRFSTYQRQNLADESDFSCGIAYLPRSGRPLTLARYNGPSHVHGDIRWRPHIHRATEETIAAGRKPESEATQSDRYGTLEGALACLIEDFDLAGIEARADQPRLL